LRPQLIITRLTGHRGGGGGGGGGRWHHLIPTSAATAQGIPGIRIRHVMMGARGSPRVASDLGSGGRVGVRLGATRGMGVRTSRLRQRVLTGAQTTSTTATTAAATPDR